MKVFGIVLALLSATTLAMPAAQGDLQVGALRQVLVELVLTRLEPSTSLPR